MEGLNQKNEQMSIQDYCKPDSSLVRFEYPEGARDHKNKNFILANKPIQGTLLVFLNGVLQEEGEDNDYVVSGRVLTLVHSWAPGQTDKLYVFYSKQ